MSTIRKMFPITKSLPQDYEKWLENYEANGWHLKKISLGGWIHHFVKEEPKKFRYCYDYQKSKKKDYETVFSDVGWQFVYYCFGAYIWRIEYDNERPEAFSDNTSIIGRNNRFIGLVLVCFLPYMLTIILDVIHSLDVKSLGMVRLLFYIVSLSLYVSIIGGLLYTNSKLKKQAKK